MLTKMLREELRKVFPDLQFTFSTPHSSPGFHFLDMKVISYTPTAFDSVTEHAEKYFETKPFGEYFVYGGFRKKTFKVFATSEDLDKNNVSSSFISLFWEKTEDQNIYVSNIDLGMEVGWTFTIK